MPTADEGLLERERELEVLHAQLDEAASGRGAVLVLEGPAGVGKSALLAALARAGRAAGVRVLTAIGGELEREYPYGMLRQLLEAELRGADEERRARLLSGAAALAAPVVGVAPRGDDAPGASADAAFATLHGLYWLVAALSDEQPLLLVLDDVHWSDAVSLRFVEFLARRVAELPVLVALGVRPREPGAETRLIDTIADGDHAAAIRPAPLSPAGVDTVVARGLGERAGEGVAGAAYTATGGNPLLVGELVNALAASPGELSAAAVEAVVPSSVTRSVQRRLNALPAQPRAVAEALATLGDRDARELLELSTGLDATAAEEALAVLRAVDLVAPADARFVHPLVRQAVADAVPIARRHALHATVARALHARRGRSEDVIVHLLARPPLGESWATEMLLEGARRALAEGAPESAVRRIERAIEEQAGGAPAADLLLALGEAMLSAGDPGAAAALSRAAEAEDAVVAARAARLLVATQSLSGTIDGPAAARRLETALERLGDDAPLELVDAVAGSLVTAMAVDRSMKGLLGETAMAPRERDLPAVASLRAYVGASGDLPRADVLAAAQFAMSSPLYAELRSVESPHTWFLVGGLHLVDAFDLARSALTQAAETARRHGSRMGQAFVSTVHDNAVQLGFVPSEQASAYDARDVWREAGFDALATTATAQIATALVLRGRLDEADALLNEPETGQGPIGTFGAAQLLIATARVRMAQRRPAEAVRAFRDVQAIADDLGMRRYGWGFTGVDFATALAAGGQVEEARAMAEEEVALARRADRPSQLVAALTARALLLEGDEQIELLQHAVAVGPEARAPLALATARIELGAALRRHGLRQEARRWLREGAEIAGRANCTALEARALEETVVAGGRPRSRYSSGVESLTPSERRVAEYAAAGRSNREIAEALFVTRKTVELHLGRAYGKLGIRSRTQLPESLGADAAA